MPFRVPAGIAFLRLLLGMTLMTPHELLPPKAFRSHWIALMVSHLGSVSASWWFLFRLLPTLHSQEHGWAEVFHVHLCTHVSFFLEGGSRRGHTETLLPECSVGDTPLNDGPMTLCRAAWDAIHVFQVWPI